MKLDKTVGILCAALSAVSFGMNPLFALPLYRRGMSTGNVLFYRLFFATLLLGGFMLLSGKPFRLRREQILPAVVSGVMLALTCLFLFLSFWVMDAGLAATILFVYPLMVALIMRFRYGERMPRLIWGCLLFALGGVALMCLGGGAVRFSVPGLICVLLSALIYAIYIVMVRQSSLRELASETLTFYAMLFSVPVFLLILRGGVDLRMPPDLLSWVCVFGLALFPALLSFLLIAVAIRRIGATVTAMFGACEPVTSILIGVLIFGEALTLRIVCGAAVVLSAVTLAATGGRFDPKLDYFAKLRRAIFSGRRAAPRS